MMDIYETWKVDKEDSGSRILPSIVLTMFDKKIDGLHSMLAGPANKKSLEEECVFTCIFWLWIYFTSLSEGVQDWNTVWNSAPSAQVFTNVFLFPRMFHNHKYQFSSTVFSTNTGRSEVQHNYTADADVA